MIAAFLNWLEHSLGKGAGDIMQKVTVTVGTVQAGVKVNMVPASCVFETDIRLPIGLEKARAQGRGGPLLSHGVGE